MEILGFIWGLVWGFFCVCVFWDFGVNLGIPGVHLGILGCIWGLFRDFLGLFWDFGGDFGGIFGIWGLRGFISGFFGLTW